jgi:hypothetical protein
MLGYASLYRGCIKQGADWAAAKESCGRAVCTRALQSVPSALTSALIQLSLAHTDALPCT